MASATNPMLNTRTAFLNDLVAERAQYRAVAPLKGHGCRRRTGLCGSSHSFVSLMRNSDDPGDGNQRAKRKFFVSRSALTVNIMSEPYKDAIHRM